MTATDFARRMVRIPTHQPMLPRRLELTTSRTTEERWQKSQALPNAPLTDICSLESVIVSFVTKAVHSARGQIIPTAPLDAYTDLAQQAVSSFHSQ